MPCKFRLFKPAGDADKKLDRGGPGLGVRMYSREDVELALEGLAEGMSVRDARETQKGETGG